MFVKKIVKIKVPVRVCVLTPLMHAQILSVIVKLHKLSPRRRKGRHQTARINPWNFYIRS